MTQNTIANGVANGAAASATAVQASAGSQVIDAYENVRKVVPLESIHVELDEDGKPFKTGRQSSFMRALAFFIVLNMVLAYTNPIDFDKFEFPYKGWAWWTFNDLRKSPQTHNVALLGSSLMVSAVGNCDAMRKQEQLNLAVYHKAEYLDEKLEKTFGGKFNTYNLAGPGQMPSDAYMTLQSMLKTHQRPDVVVYGVAPRDFYDSSMASPVDTEPFRFLSRIVENDEAMPLMFKSPWDKFNWVLEHNIWAYRNALDMNMFLHDKTEQLLDKLFPPATGKDAFTYWDRIKLLPDYKMGEIHPFAVVIHPQDPNGPPKFVDNTPEYSERYKRPDKDIYKIQWKFLVKLAELCKRERIELVVVNMPITLDNIKVLGGYRYMPYLNALQVLAMDHDVEAFDLNDFVKYQKGDYHDGVHLNAFGGTKLMDRLVEIFENTPSIAKALELSGQHLQHKNLLRRAKVAGKAKPPKFNTDIPM